MVAVVFGLAAQIALVQYYTPRLTAEQPAVRVEGLRQLAKIEWSHDAWDGVWLGLTDQDRSVRLAAIDYYFTKGGRYDPQRDGSPSEYNVRVVESLERYALGQDVGVATKAARALAEYSTMPSCGTGYTGSYSDIARQAFGRAAEKNPRLMFGLLSEPSADVFGNAMWSLVKPFPGELEQRLVTVVRTTNDLERRALAVRGIHSVDKPEGRRLALHLMEFEDNESSLAAQHIVGDDPAFALDLTSRYEALSRGVRSSLIQAAGRSCEGRTDILRKAIHDTNPDLRLSAWKKISLEEAGRGAVAEGLTDPDKDVRREAAQVLCFAGNASDIPTLEAHYNRDGYRDAPLGWLAEDIGVSAIPLAKRLMVHRDPGARAVAVDVVIRGKLTDLKPALIRLVADPSEEVRCAVAREIDALQDALTDAHLSRLVQDPSKNVRWSMADNLDYLKSRGIPLLRRLVNDPDEDVRSEAEYSLQKLGG